jgi:hypothetical protein
MLAEHLSGTALKFVSTQVLMAGRKGQGRRWSLDDKSLALSLYHASPKSYRLLSKIFLLPAKRTLARLLRSINLYPGFNPQMLNAFKDKVSHMSALDRQCSIVFDEMAIKSNITYDSHRDKIEGLEDLGPIHGQTNYVGTSALVFMARGLHSTWKQPIGYFVTSSTVKPEILKSLLVRAVDFALVSGLEPLAVVCDQGSNNQSCLKNHLGVSTEKPYFMHKDQKIVCMYDPPHLMKNVRNNLRENGFLVSGERVCWEHIEKFYKEDCKLPIRCAPKLSDKHFMLPVFSSMRVRLATQILSSSVAKGIGLFASLNVIPGECLKTGKFCQFFDQLFNSFNSASLKSGKPFEHALQSSSTHWAFFGEAKEYLQSIRPAKRQSLPCLSGWVQNINAVRFLQERLDSQPLFTRRLNQDCIENLFFQIRSKGGSRENPDSEQFRGAIRDVMVDKIMLTSDTKNCEDDSDNFLASLNSFTHVSPPTAAKENDTSSEDQNVIETLCQQSYSLTEHDYS